MLKLLVSEDTEIAQQVANPNSSPVGFARVRWTDSLLGCAQRFARIGFLRLLESVDLLVEVEHQVSAVRHDQPLLPIVQPLRLVLRQLLEQSWQVDDHSVS